MRDRQNMEGLWKASRRPLFIAAAAILIYEGIENIGALGALLTAALDVISPLITAVFVAFIVNLPMRAIEERLPAGRLRPGARRGIALLSALAAVFAVISGLLLIVAPRLAESLIALAAGLDGYLDELMRWCAGVWEELNLRSGIEQGVKGWLAERLGVLGRAAGEGAERLLEFTVQAASAVVDCLFAVAISIYALYSKETLQRQARKLIKAVLGEEAGKRAAAVAARSHEALRSYFFGMAAECLILGAMCFAGMTLLGFPYALLISVLVGASQIVPIVGPWASAAVSVLLMFVVAPERTLWFLAFIVVVQQLEGGVIYPRVVGGAVGIPGLWVMISVLLGARVMGLAGAVLGVPAAAVAYSILRDWINARLAGLRAAVQEERQGME